VKHIAAKERRARSHQDALTATVATQMTWDTSGRRHYNRAARITFVALPDAFGVGGSESRNPQEGWTRKRGPVRSAATDFEISGGP